MQAKAARRAAGLYKLGFTSGHVRSFALRRT